MSRKPDGTLDLALVLYDIQSKTYRVVDDVKVTFTFGCFWLPDSRRILLQSGAGELSVFDRESGQVKQAGSIGPGAYNSCLSRDGRGLYANKGGRVMTDVWMLDYTRP